MPGPERCCLESAPTRKLRSLDQLRRSGDGSDTDSSTQEPLCSGTPFAQTMSPGPGGTGMSAMDALAHVGQLLMVGLAAGAIAGFLVPTDLSHAWIAVAGVLGAVLESALPLDYGPALFGHSIVVCLAASVSIILVLWLGRKVYRVFT